MVSMCGSTFLPGRARGIEVPNRVKNTTSNTITQFIFFVIKEVSLDIDGRVTVRLPPARALEPTENDCAAHGMQTKSPLTHLVLRDFAPAGRQEKAGTSHLPWSAKIQPVQTP